MNNLQTAQILSPTPPQPQDSVLAINLGSSSIKFAVFEKTQTLPDELSLEDLAPAALSSANPSAILQGEIKNIGHDSPGFSFIGRSGEQQQVEVAAQDRQSIIKFFIEWLEQQDCFASIKAVGHRVVHGMHYAMPEVVSTSLLDELRRISPYDPEHLPQEIEMMEALRSRHPELIQVACFDTSFHRSMPRVAKLLAIPRRFNEKGIERFGFHGLSYAYLIQELERLGDPTATEGRVVIAHLGNGASMAAVRDGKSIDTTMCFTPASGLPMSTRSGDLDPGLISYLMQSEAMDNTQLRHFVNSECGLLGISETSSDMRVLLQNEAKDVRAAEAIAMFCYQAKKCIGAYAAALGGIDTLVFSGGIGEHAPIIRARICEGLEFLGIQIDNTSNASAAELISSGRTNVRVMHTNEELMIARSVLQMLPLSH